MEKAGQANAIAAAITVSQLNRQVKTLLEQGIARLWVEGEISNIAKPASGHLYFTLKDKNAQIRAAFFRQRQRGPTIGLKNGDLVLVYGKVSLYEPRGDYQLIVEQVEPAGEGALKRQFDALKRKLSDEGLFDESLKQELPPLPTRIGVITSPSGAAIRDIVSVLGRRFPSIPVVIYPAAVQGEAAPAELIAALRTAIRRDECDVLIIGRGGGSLEDLWAFNDEAFAREIVASLIPVVSAVGHEVDFTIADFVADLRAPTPSGAAELVVPDQQDWMRTLASLMTRLGRLGQRALEDNQQTIDWLTQRMGAGLQQYLVRYRQVLQTRHGELMRLSPAAAVQRSIGRSRELNSRLGIAARQIVTGLSQRLALAARGLNSVSPLATLERGYAVVRDNEGKVLMDAGKIVPGTAINAQLAKGVIHAEVTKADDDDR